MRFLAVVTILTVSLSLRATTLERMSMDDIATKSTTIVRGTVGSCAGELRHTMVFTRCEINVTETWKGTAAAKSTVYVPGGAARGLRQNITGVPQLAAGQEYVFFLWSGRSGINQIIGLTQGVFELRSEGKTTVATRAAANARVVDANGSVTVDQDLRYTATELKQMVTRILEGASR